MRRYDLPLVALTAVLLSFGMLMMYSASAFEAAEDYDDPWHFVVRQSFAVFVGLGALVVAARSPYRRLRKLAPTLYGAAIVGLVAVWIPGLGHVANGAHRWIDLGPVNFQPAEFAKLVALICLGAWIHRNRANLHDPRVLGLAALGLVPLLALTLAQPDFGSTAIMLVLCGVMVFLAGLRWSWILGLGGLAAAAGTAVMVAEPYRRDRLTSFLEPFEHCQDEGYQVCQSLVAIHNGGVLGQGVGESQAKLHFLPEPHNDFIAAVIGEELGLIGMTGLVLLFAALAWRGFSIARRAPDMFGSLLAGTFTTMLVGQACLNLGVVLSVVPPKGLVLPFISYGPSAMMVNLAAVGILLSIAAELPEPAAQAVVPAGQPA